jgi:hypothetical protein
MIPSSGGGPFLCRVSSGDPRGIGIGLKIQGGRSELELRTSIYGRGDGLPSLL